MYFISNNLWNFINFLIFYLSSTFTGFLIFHFLGLLISNFHNLFWYNKIWEIRNLTTLCLLPLVYNGFSLSSFSFVGSFFWTSFHSLSSPTLGISQREGFYLPDPCELNSIFFFLVVGQQEMSLMNRLCRNLFSSTGIRFHSFLTGHHNLVLIFSTGSL